MDIARREGWMKLGFFFFEIPGKGLVYNTHTCTTMIHGLFSKNRFVEGWKLFGDMETQQMHPNLQTYTTLLDGLCRNGEIDEAISLVHIIEDNGLLT